MNPELHGQAMTTYLSIRQPDIEFFLFEETEWNPG